MIIQSQPSFHDYFSANTSIDRGWIKNGLLAAFRTAAESPKITTSTTSEQIRPKLSHEGVENQISESMEQSISTRSVAVPEEASVKQIGSSTMAINSQEQEMVLPHRRRKKRGLESGVLASSSSEAAEKEEQLPLDASSQLTTAAAALPSSATIRRKFATYLSLTKPRLSFLIILTTASAYSLYPIPEILSNATHAADATSTLSTSTLTLTFLTVGTFLCSASANTFNMLFEPKYDALMTRTRNRPLVRKLISQRAAAIFALLCGGGGIILLGLGTNPTVAALGALNIFMYAGVYTPMKRLSPINTWVGAIVGGIPPLMGWCAAAGEAATSEHHSWRDLLLSEDSIGGWLLAALLFAWQFPHFNSLSHTIRDDYRNAGHKMLAWMNPAMNARVALRYSFAMFPICAGLYWVGVVNSGFLAISTACNVWMTKEAIRFYKKQGAGGSARGLFWASVWQLPLVLVGALVCKVGIWDGFFERDPVSIYEELDEVDPAEGEGLSMMSATESRPSELNMSMLGFKRPG
jgi:protoheme IX farnesyltransferase